MMPGLSFSPFNQKPNQAAPGQQSAPVQDAIKIMSFRMPSVVGAGAPAPQGLLGGPTGQGGSLDSGLLQEFLRRILMGQGGQPQSAGGPAGGAGLPGAMTPFGSPQTTNFEPGSNPFQPSQASAFQPPAQAPDLTPSFQFNQDPGRTAPPASGDIPAPVAPMGGGNLFENPGTRRGY